MLTEHLSVGVYDYLAFRSQSAAYKANPANKPDSTLLTKGDSALSFVQQKQGTPSLLVPQYRAYINDYKDPDYATLKGLSKPYYEQIIQILSAKSPLADRDKSTLADAYAYLGTYYQYHDKDDAKALDNFTKARDMNPNNGQAKFYFDNKANGGATPKTPTPPATPAKKSK